MLSYLRKTENSFLQGAVFIANLYSRRLRYKFNFSRVGKKINLKSTRELTKFKSSDTLFILGSGESIAKYPGWYFDNISQHDSIGFNFWLLHKFVPTFYVGEVKEDCQRSQDLWENLRARSREYKNTPIIFKYNKAFLEQSIDMPNSLKELFILNYLNIPGKSLSELGKWLTYLDRRGYFGKKDFRGTILFRQASLSWLLVFAVHLGYKKIVLCGVDLNTPKYFFDIPSSVNVHEGMKIPDPGFEEKVHPTFNADLCQSGLAIPEILEIMNQSILENKNIELLVASETSALFPQLPLYNWAK